MLGLVDFNTLRDLGLTIVSLGGTAILVLMFVREGYRPARRGLVKTEQLAEFISKIDPALEVINAQMTMNGGKTTLVDRVAMIPSLKEDVAAVRAALEGLPCVGGGCPALRDIERTKP